jgi:DNA-directed RNA polymerase specialized sigma24 family protein
MREIAAVLDTSEGTVKSMIFRSLQKLKTILAESEQS